MVRLLEDQTTNGDGTPATWDGGKAIINLFGTTGGATATLYIDIGGGYNTNADLAKMETGLYEVVSIPAGSLLKMTVSNAGASTDLSAIMVNT